MADLKHDVIIEIKALAANLGTTPTRKEWQQVTKLSPWGFENAFGSWTAAIEAAGLQPKQNKKITAEDVFGRDIEIELANYAPRLRKTLIVKDPILVIPDLHLPFSHQKTLDKIYRFAEKEQPKYIVQEGDLYDMFSWSKFAKSSNIYKPDDEFSLGRKQAEAFWKELTKACPRAKKFQLKGNHDDRPFKRILEVLPAFEGLLKDALKPHFVFPGVSTIDDSREELMIQGIQFVHGYMSRPGGVRDFILGNSVVAHTHRMGTVYRPLQNQIIWELNPGFVGDVKAKVFHYTPQQITGWTLGWGWIDEYGPRAIPG